ncbi:MAG: STAS/SEC14 domain-containing protein [Methanoregula sp.]|nr:STAS/SEC14 domain-containing protein [Methanoregula sp.]
MIKRLPESSGNVIGFEIKGQLADEDYKQVLIPAVEEVIKAKQKFRVLFQMQDFTGWTAHGAWDDFVNGPKFLSCERLAIVVDEG